MTEDELKQLVIAQLRQFGMEAEPIPEQPDKKTADIKGSMLGEVFLFELKQRERVIEYVRDLETLAHGEIAEQIPELLKYRNNHSAVVRDGIKQLEATIDRGDEYRLLWLDAGEADPDLDAAQYEATLCGERHLFCLGHSTLFSCYFFTESEFFTNRAKLDGAVVSDGKGWKLLLNSYSPRYERLKSTEFVKKLGGAAWDPLEMEKQGRILIADTDLDRRDEAAVLNYIFEKYGLQANVMPLRRYGAIIAIDPPKEDA